MAPGSLPLISSRFSPSDIVMKGRGQTPSCTGCTCGRSGAQDFAFGCQARVSGCVSCNCVGQRHEFVSCTGKGLLIPQTLLLEGIKGMIVVRMRSKDVLCTRSEFTRTVIISPGKLRAVKAVGLSKHHKQPIYSAVVWAAKTVRRLVAACRQPIDGDVK